MGTLERSVDDADFGSPSIGKTIGDGTRAASGADEHCRPRVGSPQRPFMHDVVHEAIAVVVGAGCRPGGQ